MSKILHEHWPMLPAVDTPYWDIPQPMRDLVHALSLAAADDSFATATPIPQRIDSFDPWDIKEIIRYFVSYEGTKWDITKEDAEEVLGTEAVVIVLCILEDGRWASISARCDYTGWDCQARADVRVGESDRVVIEYGLTLEEIDRLGITNGGKL